MMRFLILLALLFSDMALAADRQLANPDATGSILLRIGTKNAVDLEQNAVTFDVASATFTSSIFTLNPAGNSAVTFRIQSDGNTNDAILSLRTDSSTPGTESVILFGDNLNEESGSFRYDHSDDSFVLMAGGEDVLSYASGAFLLDAGVNFRATSINSDGDIYAFNGTITGENIVSQDDITASNTIKGKFITPTGAIFSETTTVFATSVAQSLGFTSAIYDGSNSSIFIVTCTDSSSNTVTVNCAEICFSDNDPDIICRDLTGDVINNKCAITGNNAGQLLISRGSSGSDVSLRCNALKLMGNST